VSTLRRLAPAGALAALTVLLVAPLARAADPPPVTPAGWRVAPAGVEIGVPRGAPGMQGPLGAALSPDGSRLLVASSGAARIESADLFDLTSRTRSDLVPYDALQGPGQSVFFGATFAPDGRHAWVSGGGQDVVHRYRVSGGRLIRENEITTPFFPAGIAYGRTPRGNRLYVANNLATATPGEDGNIPGRTVTVIDPKTSSVLKRIDLGRSQQPFGVAFDRTGRRAYVTNWLGRSVSVLDTTRERPVAHVELSPRTDPARADHPSAITANPQRDEVYTANASSDTVSVLSTRQDRVLATIDVALVPGGPKGAIPDGVAVSPDGGTLYVAEAGENAVAVVDLDSRRVEGFIPTAWYPAAVAATPDGKRIVVTNTNDAGAGANPCGPLTPRAGCPPPRPDLDPPGRRDDQYSGSMIKGSVQIVDVPSDAQLAALTRQVLESNQALARGRGRPDGLSAIHHVIYVIKENRTYDQVFGDLPKGDGDPSLALFKDDSAPNHRALARRFVTLDNFYADAEVSADGHNWSTQATATDYVDKTWPINYSPAPRGRQRAYDFEDVPFEMQYRSEPLQGDPSITRSAAARTGGYLWDNAYFNGVSFRDYGEFTQFDCGGNGNVSHTTHLDDSRFGDHVDERYPGYGLSCPDHVQREPEWEREFRAQEASGQTPQLSIVRLPNDHTMGTRAGAATPQAYVADNDLALGRLVDAVSHSSFWASTAILVAEDDAQNGPDHVDAHRTVALAISPYTQHARVDSTHYDTASMIATMEDLLGLPPMSITDARATRMWASFAGAPDLTPYSVRNPTVVPFGDPGAPTNPATAPMARASARWDLEDADAAPEIALNRAIWKSIKGRHARMPAPRHERIIGSRPNDEEADGD
jgi:YVTN family beta-propeller protein